MKRNKKKLAKCSSCNTVKHRTEMKEAIVAMEKLDRAQYKHYAALKLDAYNSFIDIDFEWACDACLQSKKAIAAHPSLQNYCWNPNFAYSDKEIICRSCNRDFIFTKDEKKFWFEQLKFWIDSTPVNCVDCRKEQRQLKKENTTISAILKKEEGEMSIAELKTVIEIYANWEKEQRAKYFGSILRKRLKKDQKNTHSEK